MIQFICVNDSVIVVDDIFKISRCLIGKRC